ncbi:GumC family protein [Pseudothermotoga thermarum]|uniref:Lipopolysaccharide biosynthesis protein n=1 Tax=Pseudothermotoga thermarum DSM 5069 TaxID=688269 RepID=F7YVL0_9THEM|nr:GumC family protein [Pseudothermotoga thermarum]AEH51668.1 lipopolysaccharide biosynthesis protein [Pseudothermotoga thermarum DSM 5069]
MNQEYIDEISLSEIFKILWKRKKTVISIFLLVFFATLVYLLVFYKPKYEAYATIRIPAPSRSSISLPSELGALVGLPETGSSTADQIALLKSRRVLEPTIKESGLYEYYLNRIEKEEDKKRFTPDLLVSSVLKEMKIEMLEKSSNVMKISFAHESPELAHTFLSKLVKNFIRTVEELTKDQNVATKEYIETVLPTIERELTQLELQLSSFVKETSYNPSEEAKMLVNTYFNLEQRIAEVQTSIEAAKATINFTNQKLKEMNVKINLPENISSPVIDQLKSQLASAQVELQVLKEKYSENSYEVKMQEARVRELESKLKEEITKTLSARVTTGNPLYDSMLQRLINATAELETLRINYNALLTRKQNLEQRLSQLPDFEQRLARLRLEYQIKQATYAMLKQKLAEVNLTLAGYSTFVPVVVDEPRIPVKPAGLGKKIILALAGVAGLFLGIVAGLLRDISDKYIRDELDLRNYTVPILDASKPSELAILVGKNIAAGKKKLILASLNDYDVDILAKRIPTLLNGKIKVVDEDTTVSFDTSQPVLIKVPNFLDSAVEVEKLSGSVVYLVLEKGKVTKESLRKFVELTNELCEISAIILV